MVQTIFANAENRNGPIKVCVIKKIVYQSVKAMENVTTALKILWYNLSLQADLEQSHNASVRGQE
jgi:hypothetical protein